MSVQHSPHALKAAFLRALDLPAAQSGSHWAQIWRLFLADPWYREQLDVCARRALRKTGGRPDWLDDIKQDAVLALAAKLRRRPGLGIDPQKAQGHFEGWIGTILDRDCRASLRRLRAVQCRQSALPLHAVGNDPWQRVEQWIDVKLVIDRLNEPVRTATALHVAGTSPRDVARTLGISYWTAVRAIRRGIAALRERLGPRRPSSRTRDDRAGRDWPAFNGGPARP